MRSLNVLLVPLVLGMLLLGACNKAPRTTQVETPAEPESRLSSDDPADWVPAPIEGDAAVESEDAPAADDGALTPTANPSLEPLSLPIRDFSFRTLDDKTLRLSEYVGKPVVLNFWADWCPPCVAEMPHFAEVYKARAGQFELISITDRSSRDPEGFVSRGGFDWTFGLSDEAPGLYELEVWPTTVFIDRSGVIRNVAFGGIDAAEFERRLALIL